MKEVLKERFKAVFNQSPEYLFSAPGRTEISGNHTDHQHGCVLAGAVNLETLAAVCKTGEKHVRVYSEGYDLVDIDLDDLESRSDERGTTASIIRGTLAWFAEAGAQLGGFDAYVTSTVLPGSGLSSSASFEVLVGSILNELFFNGKYSGVELAQIGQWAENVCFGKPCGLMDQTACAVGGILSIDFADPSNPIVEKVPFDFAETGHALCIIDSGADHADLTDDYAAITVELRKICEKLGYQYLRDVPEEAFNASIPELRRCAGDRAVLRAVHVYHENKRVARQVDALKAGDFEAFLKLVDESGYSSWMLLQNVIPAGRVANQEVALAIALARDALQGRGACRVHGGGFAGTIQAFVPLDILEPFRARMESVLGEGRCHVLSIRGEGCGLADRY